MMKKIYMLIILFLFFIILITTIGSAIITGDILIDELDDILVVQSNKEVYFNVYGYDIENPNIIINPYGNSPLTAIVMFTSSDYSDGEVIIKSKDGNSDISYKFGKDKYHIIPIYGLYADYDNTVIIRCENTEKVINVKTDKLPDDFKYLDNMIYENFVFYNSNYPYLIDGSGEVRWYLNSNYYGEMTVLDNYSFIIGSDRYNEFGNVVSFYKMNFLGKIYNEYLINEYYGKSTLYNGDLLVLSDKVLCIDIQTGEIISDYGNNEGYEYLEIYEDNIIVTKDNVFYILNNGNLTEVEHTNYINKISFSNSLNNYNIISSNRFGYLNKTVVSDKKFSLIGYKKLDRLENINIIREVDRIKVTNNNDENIYVILDKFMDKKIYEVDDVKYINMHGLNGKYTIYFKIDGKVFKTDYFVEV